MRRNLAWIWILAGTQVGLAAAAAAADSESGRPVIAPAPDWVLPPLPAVPPSASDAPVQVLLNDQQIRITGEVMEFYSVTRIKVQSPQGLGAVGTLSFAWKPDTDLLTVHQLTATRDGQIRNLLGDGQDFTILRREDQLEQAILTGMLTAVLQPPGLQVGDVIEMRYTLRRKDPVVGDTPDGAYIWPNSAVGSIRLRTLWPDSLPVRWRASAQMPASEPVKQGGWNELIYQMDSPVPLMQPTGAPGRFAALRMVELTTFRDWSHLSQHLAPLYRKAATLAADSPLRAELARIRQQHRTPVARAAAALRLAQDQIRYVLLAMNSGGLVPASADETWQRRFGDCKAKTSLLLALLGELGIEADPVAVSTGFGDGMDARLPAIGLFDHVLVRAKVDGKTYWLDGTRTGDRSLAMIQPPPFQWALPLLAKGSPLVEIPQAPLPEPQVVRSLDIDASQGVGIPAPFRAEMVMTGDAARSLKNAWDSVPAANLEEGLRAFWREQYRGVEIEATETSFDDELGRLVWKASGQISMEWDPEYDTYEPHDMGLGYRADFTRPRGTDASAPYLVQFPVHTRNVETIRLPAQSSPFTVAGTDIERTVAGFVYRRKARVEGNRFTAEVTERSMAPEFPASQKAEAERVLLEMSRNNLFLKKPARYLPSEKELLAELEQEFDKAEDYYTLGMDLMRRNLVEPSGVTFDKALALDPKHAGARIGRVEVLRRKGEYEAAIAELETGLALKPELRDLTSMQESLALLRVRRGETDAAVQLLDAILERGPHPRALLARANVMQMQGKPDLTLRDVNAAIAADPKQPEAHALKVRTLIALSRLDEAFVAAEAFEAEARNAKIEGITANFMMGSALDAAGQSALARQYYDRGLVKNPDAFAFMARARLQEEKGAVLSDIRKAMALPNVSSSALGMAGKVLFDRKWYREALEVFTWYDEEKGSSFRIIGMRGIARWQLGDKAGATKDFAAARDLVPSEQFLNELCWEKATFNVALEEALKDCDAALAALPSCNACKDSRAFVLLRSGRFKEAEEAYSSVLRLVQQSASLYGRGIARIRLGNKEAGEKDLVEAVIASPGVKQMFEEAGVQP